MAREKIISGVIDCVSESLATESANIQSGTRLTADLGADSLDFMDIMFGLERRFGVSLQKEDFDLLARTQMKREEAIVCGKLSQEALNRLRHWLPSLPESGDVMARDLGSYITIETMVKIIETAGLGSDDLPVAANGQA